MEQSSYYKLRLVLQGDLDLLSNLFLGVLLSVDLTGDACLVFFFISGGFDGNFCMGFVRLFFFLIQRSTEYFFLREVKVDGWMS